MNQFEFTFEEVLKEIERLSTENKEGFSISDMSDKTGRPKKWCRAQINKGIKIGKIKYNGHVKRQRMDGRPSLIPVYVVVKQTTQNPNFSITG